MDHFPQAGPSACGVPKSRIPLAVLLAAAAIFTLTNWSLTLGVMQPGPNSDGTNPEQGASRETVADESRDLYGDPLPADAVLRLGTVRLRHADNFSSIAFTPSGETLMTTGRWDPEIRFWDVRTGRLVRTFRGTVGD